MKKFIPLYIALFFAPSVMAQELMSVYEAPDEEKSVLQINSMNYYASNRYNNALTDSSYLAEQSRPILKIVL